MARAAHGAKTDATAEPPRSPARRERPAPPAAMDLDDAIAKDLPPGNEAIRATLAEIAVELAASGFDERPKRGWRIALVSGALVTSALVVFTVWPRDHDRDLARSVVTTGSVGDVSTVPLRDTALRDTALRDTALRDTAPSRATAPPADPAPAPAASPRPTSPVKTAGKKAARPAAARKSSPPSKEPTTPLPAIGALVVRPSNVRVGVSHSVTLTAMPIDDEGAVVVGRRISWASSARRVATVSSTGVVTGRAPGTATITARSGGKKESVVVTVTR